MKQKYTKYIAGLLIGLFNLSTLSSCVDTRQMLGAHGSYTVNEEQGNDNNEHLLSEDRNSAKKSNDWTLTSKLCCIGGGLISMLGISSMLFYVLNNSAEPINQNSNGTITIAGYPVNHANISIPLGSILNSPGTNSISNFLHHSKDYENNVKNKLITRPNSNAPEPAVSQSKKLNELTPYELEYEISQPNFNLTRLNEVDPEKLTPHLLGKLAKNSWGMPRQKLENTIIKVAERGNIDLDQPNNGGLTPRNYMEDYNPWLIKLKLLDKHKKRGLRMKNP